MVQKIIDNFFELFAYAVKRWKLLLRVGVVSCFFCEILAVKGHYPNLLLNYFEKKNWPILK